MVSTIRILKPGTYVYVLLTCAYSTNLVIILVMMQASKKIPFEDENVLWGVRGLYVLSNIIIFGVYMYVKMQIDKKRGMYLLSILDSLGIC